MTVSQLIETLEAIREQYGNLEVAFLFDDDRPDEEQRAIVVTYDVEASPFQFMDDEKIVAGLRVPTCCDCPECQPPSGPEKTKRNLRLVQ